MAQEPTKPTVEEDDSDRGFFDLPDFGRLWDRFRRWCGGHPGGLVLLLALAGLLGFYYFGIKAFVAHTQSAGVWTMGTWNANNDQEHCFAILPIALLLALMRWRDLEAAEIRPSNRGLFWLVGGVLALILGIRCVEGRYTIIALPMLIYGAVMYVFGRRFARILAFPCIFLLFMIPLGGLVQGTAGMQAQTAQVVQFLCGLVGIPIRAEGANLHSADASFLPLEVAGGCSGIRSLMAMMTLAALYAYFVMRTPIRGFLLFCCSLLFALIGNLVRVFSIVLVARFMGSNAAHQYHEWSGFVFFPVAVLAMVGVGNVLNWRFQPATGAGRLAPVGAPPSRPHTLESPTPILSADGVAAEIPASEPLSEPPPGPAPETPRVTYDY